MASSQECRMNTNWVVADGYVLDPTVDLTQLKNFGSFWGSWKTWRACGTDNVVCHNMSKADELIKRNFHLNCNFYIANSVYASLDRPQGVRLYEGNFVHDLDRQEDIIALHLAASVSDIVLLLGFDFTEQPKLADRLQEHRAHNYRSLIKQAIKDNGAVQWVAVDHTGEFRKDMLELENFTVDSLENVIELLSN